MINKRFEKLASNAEKANRTQIAHVHVYNGLAYATDGTSFYVAPTDSPDCTDCEWSNTYQEQIEGITSNLVAMIDVTTAHLTTANRLAMTMHTGSQIKRVQIDANGHMDISAENEYIGHTSCTLENGAIWREKTAGVWKGKTSEVVYSKAGEDVTMHIDGNRLADVLGLAKDCKAQRVELHIWKTAFGNMGITANLPDGTRAVVMGLEDS